MTTRPSFELVVDLELLTNLATNWRKTAKKTAEYDAYAVYMACAAELESVIEMSVESEPE